MMAVEKVIQEVCVQHCGVFYGLDQRVSSQSIHIGMQYTFIL
jgi:hypothetical protein